MRLTQSSMLMMLGVILLAIFLPGVCCNCMEAQAGGSACLVSMESLPIEKTPSAGKCQPQVCKICVIGKKYHYACNKTINANRDEPIFEEDREAQAERENEWEEEEEAKYDKCVRCRGLCCNNPLLLGEDCDWCPRSGCGDGGGCLVPVMASVVSCVAFEMLWRL